MGATKTFGILLMVLSVPVLVGSMVFAFSEDPPLEPFVNNSDDDTGYAVAGAGVGFLLIGIVLLLVSPKRRHLPSLQDMEHPQEIEIKRTEMNWGTGASVEASDQLQDSLDDVNRRMGQTKVQYGMGQLSSEAYKRLMEEYQREKSEIEKQIIERQRA